MRAQAAGGLSRTADGRRGLAGGRHPRNPLTNPPRGQVCGDVQAPGAALGTGIAVERRGGGRCRGGFRWRGRERRADQGQAVRPAAIGQEAEVTHPHESPGEHMQQEAPDEFLASQRHDLVATAVTVVLIAHIHPVAFFIEVQQPTV